MAALEPSIFLADADVFHARIRPNGIRFRYRVLAITADLDRLDEAHSIPFFSVGRFNLLGLDARDHGPRDGSSLRTHIDNLHRNAGLERPHSVTLTCFPRILGFVFNPIAIYACRDATGALVSIAYEVRNTFGGQHTYLLPIREEEDGSVAPHECDKTFYVSPFMDMALRYRFLLLPPKDGNIGVRIIERDAAGVVLTAMMKAQAFIPTRSAILKRILATPLLGFKVLAAIHWQALRLWLRGHAIRPHSGDPDAGSPVSLSFPSPNVQGKSHV